jgi:hypothetical protein
MSERVRALAPLLSASRPMAQPAAQGVVYTDELASPGARPAAGRIEELAKWGRRDAGRVRRHVTVTAPDGLLSFQHWTTKQRGLRAVGRVRPRSRSAAHRRHEGRISPGQVHARSMSGGRSIPPATPLAILRLLRPLLFGGSDLCRGGGGQQQDRQPCRSGQCCSTPAASVGVAGGVPLLMDC